MYVLAAIFVSGLLLEQSGSATYRSRAASILGYALWLLVASALLGLLRTLVWFHLLPGLPDWTPWRKSVRNACDHDALEDFKQLFGSEQELQLLKDRLAQATSDAEEQARQSQLLESELTQQQVRANLADGRVKVLLRRRADDSLLGLGLDLGARKTRVHLLQDVLLSFQFLWRLSRALGQKLAQSVLKTRHLERSLGETTDNCNRLRLDKNSLRADADDLRQQLSLATAERLELSRRLVKVHVHYTASLRARERAAEAWIAFRRQTAARHAKTSRCLFVMTLVLWVRARFLTGQLSLSNQKSTLMKAELAVARTKYKNVNARYDTLMTDCDAAYAQIAKLERLVRTQDSDLAELHEQHAAVEKSRDDAVVEVGRTQAQLEALCAKYDALHAAHTSLESQHSTLERRIVCADAQCAELAAECDAHVRASGLTIALFAEFVETERQRAEEEKAAGFQPVQEMVQDLFSRLAVTDDYVKMMSKPAPLGPRRSTDRLTPRPRLSSGALPTPPESVLPATAYFHLRQSSAHQSNETPTRLVPSILLEEIVPAVKTAIPAPRPPRASLDPEDRRPLFIQ
ncbi:hypothetical protein FA95DRAFT_1566260 [Auriscalpium vulgare]|uniref:Uncharacterized protein n=1 Tax=Auriscalpium vulgare TaxID=40419 RepID=A0ACB8R9K5_9AGAM|nr:hypothetical protein FA95DRAFT_1566260 [Auriscalpium vulgare]